MKELGTQDQSSGLLPSYSSSFALSGTGSRGQQTQQRRPDVPLPRHLLQLLIWTVTLHSPIYYVLPTATSPTGVHDPSELKGQGVNRCPSSRSKSSVWILPQPKYSSLRRNPFWIELRLTAPKPTSPGKRTLHTLHHLLHRILISPPRLILPLQPPFIKHPVPPVPVPVPYHYLSK
ncbi:hypothetical protein AMECASPLE_032628 [Ameca splendens]|uniref:Uncharacterized protein n=1 Tax=Ameca splendens TaxID=208324 RepID=A0ABV1AD13_9TELE